MKKQRSIAPPSNSETTKANGPVTRRTFLMGAGALAIAGVVASPKGVGTALASPLRRPAASPGKEGSITVMTLGGGIFGLPYLNLKSQFEKETGISVNLVQMGASEEDDQVGAILAARNSEYDVLQIDPSLLAGFAAGHNLVPMNDALPSSFVTEVVADVAPGIIKEWTVNGALMGLPTEGNCEQGQVNKKYLAELGLPVPQTWDQLLSGAQKAVAAKKGIYGFDGNMERTLYAVPTWLPIFWGNGGELWDESYEPQLTSPAALDALELLLDLVKTMPPGGASYIEAQATKAMAAGLTVYNPDGWIPDPFTTSSPPVTAELEGAGNALRDSASCQRTGRPRPWYFRLLEEEDARG